MDLKNRLGQTAVMKAVIFNDLEVLKILQKAGKYFKIYVPFGFSHKSVTCKVYRSTIG